MSEAGAMGMLAGAGKRLLTGESLFITVFTNQGSGKRRVAFGAPYPGKIIAVKLSDVGGELHAQKDSFLAAARGVSLGISLQRRLGAGFFGGEGFILQRLQGDGYAFIDTGCVVAFQPSVSFEIEFVGKLKTAFFGGEGLFFATLRGPGRIWLQSLPLSRMASRIVAAVPGGMRGGREEGSVAGWVPGR